MTLGTLPLPGTVANPLYPDSDGKPMGETDFHIAAIIWLREALQDAFADCPNMYVASNMLFYYEQGNPRARRDPDVLVARGVGKHFRRSFRTWEEQTVPRVLFEISSEETWRTDLEDKRALYAALGVGEYFLFDPEALYLDPPLQGFRLENGVSVPMTPAADGSLTSQELGLRFLPEDGMLRVFDVRTGEPIPTREERAAQERKRAAQERKRATQERKRAAQEKQRADELAAEVARLRARLKQLETPEK